MHPSVPPPRAPAPLCLAKRLDRDRGLEKKAIAASSRGPNAHATTHLGPGSTSPWARSPLALSPDAARLAAHLLNATRLAHPQNTGPV
jgi:hypothetical protein